MSLKPCRICVDPTCVHFTTSLYDTNKCMCGCPLNDHGPRSAFPPRGNCPETGCQRYTANDNIISTFSQACNNCNAQYRSHLPISIASNNDSHSAAPRNNDPSNASRTSRSHHSLASNNTSRQSVASPSRNFSSLNQPAPSSSHRNNQRNSVIAPLPQYTPSSASVVPYSSTAPPIGPHGSYRVPIGGIPAQQGTSHSRAKGKAKPYSKPLKSYDCTIDIVMLPKSCYELEPEGNIDMPSIVLEGERLATVTAKFREMGLVHRVHLVVNDKSELVLDAIQQGVSDMAHNGHLLFSAAPRQLHLEEGAPNKALREQTFGLQFHVVKPSNFRKGDQPRLFPTNAPDVSYGDFSYKKIELLSRRVVNGEDSSIGILFTCPKNGNIIGPKDNSPEPHYCFADRALAFWNSANDEIHRVAHQLPEDVICSQECPDEEEEEAIQSGDESDRESIREELQDRTFGYDDDMVSIASSEHSVDYQNLFLDNDSATPPPLPVTPLPITPASVAASIAPTSIAHASTAHTSAAHASASTAHLAFVAPSVAVAAPLTPAFIAPLAPAFVARPVASFIPNAVTPNTARYIAPITPPHSTIQSFNLQLTSLFLEDVRREAFHIRGKSVDSVSHGLLAYLKARRTAPTGVYIPNPAPEPQDLDLYNRDRRFTIIPSSGTIQQLFQMRLIVKAGDSGDALGLGVTREVLSRTLELCLENHDAFETPNDDKYITLDLCPYPTPDQLDSHFAAGILCNLMLTKAEYAPSLISPALLEAAINGVGSSLDPEWLRSLLPDRQALIDCIPIAHGTALPDNSAIRGAITTILTDRLHCSLTNFEAAATSPESGSTWPLFRKSFVTALLFSKCSTVLEASAQFDAFKAGLNQAVNTTNFATVFGPSSKVLLSTVYNRHITNSVQIVHFLRYTVPGEQTFGSFIRENYLDKVKDAVARYFRGVGHPEIPPFTDMFPISMRTSAAADLGYRGRRFAKIASGISILPPKGQCFQINLHQHPTDAALCHGQYNATTDLIPPSAHSCFYSIDLWMNTKMLEVLDVPLPTDGRPTEFDKVFHIMVMDVGQDNYNA